MLLLYRLNVSIEELDWDSDNSRHKLEELAGTQADYIIASDCLYIDEVSHNSLQHGCQPISLNPTEGW